MPKKVFLSLAVVSLTVGLRLPVLQKTSPSAFGGENERVANSLLHGNGWSDAYGAGTGPTAHVAPLYPLILQSLYRAFGNYETLSGRLAQQYCSLAVAVLVILLLPSIARKLRFPSTVGWAAAFLAAWLPAHRWHQVVGFDQTLTALALLALVACCARLQQSDWRSRRAIAALGVLLGVAALLCPNLLAAPVLFIAVEFCRCRESRPRVLQGALALPVIAAVIVAPWTIRNAVVLHGFVPLRSNLGLELAIGNRPGANGHTYAAGFYELHPLGSPLERARLVRRGEIAYMKEQQRQAFVWIADHPADFARLTLRRVFLFWFSPNDKWFSPSAKLMLGSRVYGLLGVLLIVELARLLWTRRFSGVLLACFAFGLGLPYFLTHVEVRYTLPFVHLATLASCNLAWVIAHRVLSPYSRTKTPLVASEGFTRIAA